MSQSVLADSYFKLGELGDMGSMKKAYNIWKKLAEDHPEVSKFKGARDAARDELELFLMVGHFPFIFFTNTELRTLSRILSSTVTRRRG